MAKVGTYHTLPLTAHQVIVTALAEVGTTEKGTTNLQKYGKEYGWDGVPWCGIFVWWVFKHAGHGADLKKFVGPTAGTILFHQELKKYGWKKISPKNAKKGDIVFFDFGGVNGSESDHVGLVRSNVGGELHTIEGNTSPGTGGSQRDGGGVYERKRAYGLVHSVWRPPYKTTAKAAYGRAVALLLAGAVVTGGGTAVNLAANKGWLGPDSANKNAIAAASKSAIASYKSAHPTKTTAKPTPTVSPTATATAKPTVTVTVTAPCKP